MIFQESMAQGLELLLRESSPIRAEDGPDLPRWCCESKDQKQKQLGYPLVI